MIFSFDHMTDENRELHKTNLQKAKAPQNFMLLLAIFVEHGLFAHIQ